MSFADFSFAERGRRRGGAGSSGSSRRRGLIRGKFSDHVNDSPNTTLPSNKTPIILIKPPADRVRSTSSDPPRPPVAISPTVSQPSEPAVPIPIILQKPKEDNHVNNDTKFATPSNSVDANVHPTLQQHVKVSSSVTPEALGSRLTQYPEMKGCVKLVDDSLEWCDHAVEFLADQTDYLVLGVLGLQGVGKSTIMSLIAGAKPDDSLRSYVFKPARREVREMGEHCTTGIDFYITRHRIILLDVQPVMSASVMDRMIQYEKKFPNEYPSVETAVEIQSLQLAAFLFSVCHAVILVQDWFTDPNLIRFVQTAEMLKPSCTSHDGNLGIEEQIEYYPYLVFLQTKCERENFTVENIKTMQATYDRLFHRSNLKTSGTVGITHMSVVSNLTPENTGEPVNLFLLPQNPSFDGGTPQTSVIPPYSTLASDFRRQLLSMPRPPISRTTLSEKNWFHYAARTWETVKKSNLFLEYSRLIS